ncbi:MAG: hypothetical protein RBS40_12010 [Rhodocyclaceae bacterium]|jgi:hypothetical protein|nr:hypothetical protein [Rhodocyclaceae bacterium]
MGDDQPHLLRVVDSEILAICQDAGLACGGVPEVIAQLEGGGAEVIRLAPDFYDALWDLLLVRRGLMDSL